jgi:hypothetical protein
MRTIAGGMHMRKDPLSHFSAMAALFVKLLFTNIRAGARPEKMISFSVNIIELVFPAAYVIDLRFTSKYIKTFTVGKTKVLMAQLKNRIM